MKNYTNEELCSLIAQPCMNTIKAEYYRRIKFTEEELEHKLVLHVPTQKYVNDKLVAIEYKGFIDFIIKGLEVTGFYITPALGSYKGRVYPEKLVTAFVNNEMLNQVDYYFRHAVVKFHLNMRQEAYAYELDGKLHVVSL